MRFCRFAAGRAVTRTHIGYDAGRRRRYGGGAPSEARTAQIIQHRAAMAEKRGPVRLRIDADASYGERKWVDDQSFARAATRERRTEQFSKRVRKVHAQHQL